GDWNADGVTTVGVWRPGTATWYLRNSNTPGAPDIAPFAYGVGSWTPLAGDWDGAARFRGGVNVAVADVNGDGVYDIITGVAAGVVGGDGGVDVVTGPGAGGEPLVKVIDSAKLDQVDPSGEIRASALLADFLAYDPPFRGGVYVGTGNIKGFAFTDVITGPG